MCESTPRCLPENIILKKRYRIGRVIGEGSFGITYIGKDLLLNIVVAIKEYFPLNYASRDVRGRDDYKIYVYQGKNSERYKKGLNDFYNEATILSQFHALDGIVPVRDFFYLNNTAYIVMDYIDGITLKEYIKNNGVMQGREVISMLEPIIKSLQKIHTAKVLHRDISPDNILINTDEKKLILIDFGSAREKNVITDKSLTITFKRGYTPEEQYLRKGKQGSWSDVYSLCATMYFMLTGKEPNESIERMLKDKLVPLSDIDNIDITKRQKQAIMRGMSVNADERIQNMEELYGELYNDKKYRFNIRISDKVRIIGKTAILFLVLSVTCVIVRLAVNNKKLSGENRAAFVQISMRPLITPDAVETEETDNQYYMHSFEGMTKEQALKVLAANGDTKVLIKWNKKYSSHTEKGKIMSQSIEAGTVCDKGRTKTIVFVISRGEKKYKVPYCIGKNYKTVIRKIKDRKLSYKLIYKESEMDKGIVIEQKPEYGKKVKKESVIKITVSKGKTIKRVSEIKNIPKPAQTQKSTPKKGNELKNKDIDFAGSIP